MAQCRHGRDDGADRASHDADVSIIPPKIPYGGFSPVRLQGWCISTRLPASRRPRVAPSRFASCLRAHRFQLFVLRSVSCSCVLKHYHSAATPLYPSGPSSGPGSVVPVHRHLCGPIRPARRHRRTVELIARFRCTFPLGDPRLVPCFRYAFFLNMSPSTTPGVQRLHAPSSFPTNDGLRLFSADSGLPSIPQIRSTWGYLSELR